MWLEATLPHCTSNTRVSVTNIAEGMSADSTTHDSLPNIQAYLQLCKDRTLNQQNLNREYSVKALGIITYSTTLLGVGASWIKPEDISYCGWMFLILASICVLWIASIVLGFIVAPRKWKEPIKLSEDLLGEACRTDSTTFLLEVAGINRKAVESNQALLNKRSEGLKRIALLALAELLFVLIFRIFLLVPS